MWLNLSTRLRFGLNRERVGSYKNLSDAVRRIEKAIKDPSYFEPTNGGMQTEIGSTLTELDDDIEEEFGA